MPIPCGACSKPLVAVLCPDTCIAYAADVYCRRCQAAVDWQVFTAAGVPASLLERISVWARRSEAITGVG